ncbi:MAG: murein DD-endopeptidase MepM/ murein hydrolase activator NlpD [Paraglaciecola sp.]
MVQKTLQKLPKQHKWLLSAAASMVLILALLPSEPAVASRHTATTTLEPGKRYELPVNFDNFSIEQPTTLNEQMVRQAFNVRKGDNLAKIFQRAGLTPQETYKFSRAGKDAKKLLKMMPGQSISLEIDTDGSLTSLAYSYSPTETLIITLGNDAKLSSKIENKNVDVSLNYAQGEINSSFWNAGRGANLSDNQIMNLAGIFGWDIDFALELRQGDRFSVLFEEKYIDGGFVQYGDIVAAEFVNQGESYTAIRYADGNYYTPEGHSMRKSFLRAPVSFKYISSSFKKNRFHPVQKRWKAHRGVDYAADRGTPIMAAGDGRVIRSSYDKYNGHHVFIQHGEKYVTKYLHFTKRKVKKGESVKQGQIIGTLGSTGLASGPHLHYEFLVDGVHRNPRTVTLPKALPIAKKEASAFQKVAKNRLKQLTNSKRIMLAMN